MTKTSRAQEELYKMYPMKPDRDAYLARQAAETRRTQEAGPKPHWTEPKRSALAMVTSRLPPWSIQLEEAFASGAKAMEEFTRVLQPYVGMDLGADDDMTSVAVMDFAALELRIVAWNAMLNDPPYYDDIQPEGSLGHRKPGAV